MLWLFCFVLLFFGVCFVLFCLPSPTSAMEGLSFTAVSVKSMGKLFAQRHWEALISALEGSKL